MITYPRNIGILLLYGSMMLSCEQFEPLAPGEEEVLDGPLKDLTPAQLIQFNSGDRAFNEELFHSGNGLGPLFVANSCVSCHAGDGKGTPSTTLTRFGQVDAGGNTFLHLGGPQLQNRALPGYIPEILPEGAIFSKLTPMAVTGLGFLQYVIDADILSYADPEDMDGDGISGVPNWGPLEEYLVPPPHAIAENGMYIHRFGKKASIYDLLEQTVKAYNQDIGITSTFEPMDTYSGLSIDPEISDRTIRDVVFYLETLKAPIPRDQRDAGVQNGKRIFVEIRCASCHLPEMKTGPAPIEALSHKVFYPYTDLLLHDMGPGLDDGYTEGSALTSEWRTPALWGLGLSPKSQGGKYHLMHDGRAGTIGEAILLHGGEAQNSRNLFMGLDPSEKADLIKFLESL